MYIDISYQVMVYKICSKLEREKCAIYSKKVSIW